VLIVWSYSLDTIIPTCHDFEDRLIKLLWRSRPKGGSLMSAANSVNGSVSGHSSRNLATPSRFRGAFIDEDLEKLDMENAPKPALGPVYKRTWYGKKYLVQPDNRDEDIETAGPEKRPAKLYAPFYNGLAAGLSMLFMGIGIRSLLEETELDGTYIRFALCATLPLLFSVSLFFTLQILQNVTMAFGPVAHFHENSMYYSAVKPRPNKLVDNALPHITIQMPVYKENLDSVLAPSIESLKKAMQTYARQGGTSTIFINDDGLRVSTIFFIPSISFHS
jgi:hypothetical protein